MLEDTLYQTLTGFCVFFSTKSSAALSDGFVKTTFCQSFVIPAKVGIQKIFYTFILSGINVLTYFPARNLTPVNCTLNQETFFYELIALYKKLENHF